MDNNKLNPQNRKDNVKMLRRHLRLTQKEFIDQFLCDENGKALLSIATLSNLESSGGARLAELIAIVSERLHLDPMIFSKEPEEFQATIDYVIENKYVISEKKNSILFVGLQLFAPYDLVMKFKLSVQECREGGDDAIPEEA